MESMKVSDSRDLVSRDVRALIGEEAFTPFTGAISLTLCDKIPAESRALVYGYNIAEAQGELAEWTQCALLARIWKAYKEAHPEATKTALAGFFKEKPSTLTADIRCGGDVRVVVDDDGNERVEFPCDNNGRIFSKSNYAQLYAFKGRIADGTFTADMTQKQVKETVAKLRGVVVDEPAEKKPAEAPAEAKPEAPAEAKPEAPAEEIKPVESASGHSLIVVFDGKPVELTEAQVEAIVRILTSTRKPAEGEAEAPAEAKPEAKPKAKAKA